MNDFANDFLRETFQVLKCLHKSEKNEILLVSNKNDGQLYVMKLISNVNLPYKALKNMSHPVLPKIIYVLETKNQTIAVEEYINAKKLSDIITERDNFTEELVLDIVLQLCDGLEFLHKLNIVHRDIKPSNILLTSEGKVKLIDFDAARIEKSDAHADTRYLGTKGYAPPEQYGFAQTDNRSDIYALGITIKELLGDCFRGNLIKIVDKCTQLSPKDRYQSIAELKYALITSVKPKCYKVLSVVAIIGLIAVGSIFLHVNHEYSKDKPQTQHSVDNDKKEVSEVLQKDEKGDSGRDRKTDDTTIPLQKEIEAIETKKITELPHIEEKEKNIVTTGELKIFVRCAGVETNGWFQSLAIVYPSWERWNKKRTAYYQDDFVYFPADTSVEFAIENDTENDIINPILELLCQEIIMGEIPIDISALVEKSREPLLYRKTKVLKAGEKIVGTLPLDKARTNIGDPSPSLFIIFKADNYPRKYLTVNFYGPEEK